MIALDLSQLKLKSLDGLQLIPNIKSIKKLSLANNILTALSRNNFAGLDSLEVLDLSGNPIKIVKYDSFAELENLKKLYLSDCQIDLIADDAFAHLNNLQELYLSNNKLTDITPNMLAGAYNLKILDLSFNHIKEIEPFSFNVSFLTILKLNNNRLAQVGAEQFKRLGQLQELDLSNNQLTKIPALATAQLQKLERLLLAHNPIRQTNAATLKSLPQLRLLDLAGTQLPPEQLEQIRALLPRATVNTTKTISIAQYLNQPNFIEKHMQRDILDLSGLQLTSLEGLQKLTQFKNIKSFDLSKNNFKTIPPGSFLGFDHIEEIDFSHNQIEAIPVIPLKA